MEQQNLQIDEFILLTESLVSGPILVNPIFLSFLLRTVSISTPYSYLKEIQEYSEFKPGTNLAG